MVTLHVLRKDRHLLARTDKGIETNAVVAKDGGGQFKTIGAALAAAPKKSNVRHMIYIKAGVYEEYITVDKRYTNILMYGDGPRKTIVTGRKAWLFESNQTNHPSSTAGLMASKTHCTTKQTVSFSATASSPVPSTSSSATPTVIQNSLIVVRRPMDNQVNTEWTIKLTQFTAQGRDFIDENTGLYRTKSSSRQVQLRDVLGQAVEEILDDRHGIHLGDLIKPEGWISFEKPDDFESLDTLYYSEYNNRGPGGSNLTSRVNWNGYHKIDRTTAKKFTTQSFLLSREEWLPLTGIPFTSVLRY
ncbi:probable pectinesterase/pectinesterase inhibitor 58 [Hibiscus syriacus]|uniref:probable pectinesterase/pectinesterase inhibitor 58 n=1 Tax=Hibiscus syriacus TaxID=106335 RepID=UPI001920F289|nr:probable pectinesterase/pectinesterase inhibitor 58 [Hibiscus syriacus]